ncbi:MAG: hypothetical protein U0637_02900 [Phycisphaerales bacterium]
MSLTEIMSAAGLTFYPIAAMILFLLAFTIVLARVLSRKNARTLEQYSFMPLEDDARTPRNGGAT